MSKQTMMICLIFSLLVLVANSSPANEISCPDAMKKLMPCVQYLKATAPPQPSIACCSGVNEVFKMADTTSCRRNLCECFKKAAVDLGVNPDRARQLPQLCHIPLTIPIDPKTDCSGITLH